MAQEGKTVTEVSFHPLVYYQKPAIGTESIESNLASPVQTVFPSGGFAIGIPVPTNSTVNTNENERNGLGILASGPMSQAIDLQQKKYLAQCFLLLAFVNLVITILLFSKANEIDLSKVEPSHGGLPSIFGKLSSSRNFTEQLNYGFVIFFLVLGTVSVVMENVLGISAYCLAVAVNFFLATYSLPYFIYSFRYLLDIAMLYVALVFRSRLMYTFLPIHLHRQ